jgi:ABC-type branched-subunit amino acid transport system permease subunit
VINNARPWLNGAAGLALVPQPLQDQVDTTADTYQYLYIGLTAVCVAIVWFVAARIVGSPSAAPSARCETTSWRPQRSARTRWP